MTKKALADIAVRKIPATGEVAIEFQGLDIDVRLEPGYSIALVDRVLYHLMSRQDAGIQRGLQKFALKSLTPQLLEGQAFLIYEMENGLRFGSAWSKEELLTLRGQIDGMLADLETPTAH